MFVAMGTITSHLVFIPVGFAKIFPVQHFLNVVSAVLLGPAYAVLQALLTSIIRNMMGTGSIFAFPGSIIGAFLASILFLKTKKMIWAFSGELVGTGIIGAIVSYPIAVLFLGSEAALFGFVPSFLVSSLAGALLGYILLKALVKTNRLGGLLDENSINNRGL